MKPIVKYGMVSVIIPVYNEERTIAACLASLTKQTRTDLEIIIIDDGSTDKSVDLVRKELETGNRNISLIRQKHQGPGRARNEGVYKARGDILVFVDADMEFDADFIKKLVLPIEKRETSGTFTKEEYVANWEKPLARCWNINQLIFTPRRIPENYPDTSPVFRAILKSEFLKVKGFTQIGYTDDWTLSRKLGYQAIAAKGAICYHRNPETWPEIYRQAKWIGKNEFISGNLFRRFFNLWRYSVCFQFPRSLYLAFKTGEFLFPFFNAVYSLAINVSLLESHQKKGKYK